MNIEWLQLQFEADTCFCDGDLCNKGCDCADECNYIAGNGGAAAASKGLALAIGPLVVMKRAMMG